MQGSLPEEIARSWQERPNAAFIDRMKQRSMLNQETLALLDHFARQARHGLLLGCGRAPAVRR
jgi:hypothetical protein